MTDSNMSLEPGAPESPPRITHEAGEYVLRSRIRLPGTLEEVFPFFSEARNLARITPSSVKFEVLTPDPIEMRVDALIDYRLKIHYIPVRWRTRITAWDPPHHFEDVQDRGPYKQWIHQHVFVDEGESTLMQDTVRYRVFGGALVNWLIVERDLKKIFTYRTQAIREIFRS